MLQSFIAQSKSPELQHHNQSVAETNTKSNKKSIISNITLSIDRSLSIRIDKSGQLHQGIHYICLQYVYAKFIVILYI